MRKLKHEDHNEYDPLSVLQEVQLSRERILHINDYLNKYYLNISWNTEI